MVTFRNWPNNCVVMNLYCDKISENPGAVGMLVVVVGLVTLELDESYESISRLLLTLEYYTNTFNIS